MHSFGVDLTVAGVTGIPKHDDEGRVITAEYEDFYMVNACKITFKWQIVFGFVIRPLLLNVSKSFSQHLTFFRLL